MQSTKGGKGEAKLFRGERKYRPIGGKKIQEYGGIVKSALRRGKVSHWKKADWRIRALWNQDGQGQRKSGEFWAQRGDRDRCFPCGKKKETLRSRPHWEGFSVCASSVARGGRALRPEFLTMGRGMRKKTGEGFKAGLLKTERGENLVCVNEKAGEEGSYRRK